MHLRTYGVSSALVAVKVLNSFDSRFPASELFAPHPNLLGIGKFNNFL